MTNPGKRKITFRTEIAFEGTIEEFQRASAKLVDLPFRLRAEWPKGHTAGCWPISPEKLLPKDRISKIVAGQPRIKLLTDIYGGIREPHLHLGNEIVLLDRPRFQELLSGAASRITSVLAGQANYQTILSRIQLLAGGIIVDGRLNVVTGGVLVDYNFREMIKGGVIVDY